MGVRKNDLPLRGRAELISSRFEQQPSRSELHAVLVELSNCGVLDTLDRDGPRVKLAKRNARSILVRLLKS
jgi:hypothetical protein